MRVSSREAQSPPTPAGQPPAQHPHPQEAAANHSLALQLFSSYEIRLLIKEKKNLGSPWGSALLCCNHP